MWRASPNPNRKRLRQPGMDHTPSDTIGLTKDSVNHTCHISPIAECFPNFVKLLLRHLYENISADADSPFFTTTISVNVNLSCSRHRGCANEGPSYITAAGDYHGGKLCWWQSDDCRKPYASFGPQDATELDMHGKFEKYNGKQAHEVSDFLGSRTSVVFYCWSAAWAVQGKGIKRKLK